MPIARVTNISRTLEELKDRNIWTVGLDERGTQSYDELDYNMHCAIVLGAEGKGLHDLVRKRCDFLVSIPMAGAGAFAKCVGSWRGRDVRGGPPAPSAEESGAKEPGKSQAFQMKPCFALILVGLAMAGSASALDREAFTVTHYQLEVQIDRASHVMAVTGQLTLRNDSKSPQKNLALQVSSSLSWNGIAFDRKPVEWIGNTYTSDIDHTGGLSEAVVTLPKAVLPGGNSHAGCAVRRNRHARLDPTHAHGRSRRDGTAQRLGPDQRAVHCRTRTWATWCGIRCRCQPSA